MKYKPKEKIIKTVLGFRDEFKEPFIKFKKRWTEFRSYYCKNVSRLVDELKKGYVRDNTLTHDVLRSLFANILFVDKLESEYYENGHKIDLYLPKNDLRIEIKTICNMDLDKIYKRVKIVIKLPYDIDVLWVFYFKKIDFSILNDKINRSININKLKIKCIYFLVFIQIVLNGEVELSDLNSEIKEGIKELEEKEAEKLGITGEIIIPLENLVMVEDLKKELEEKEKVLKEKEKVLKEKENELKEKEKELEKEKLAKEKEKLAKKRIKRELEELKSKLREKNIKLD
ncbi:MAG: hypothetical protein ACTSRP_24220 [Candidatus Helarchaeota archaeon]